jgi:hypothetical protein
MSVNFYQTTTFSALYGHCHEKLKSHNYNLFLFAEEILQHLNNLVNFKMIETEKRSVGYHDLFVACLNAAASINNRE